MKARFLAAIVIAALFAVCLIVRASDHSRVVSCEPAIDASCPGPAVPNYSILDHLRTGATR